MDANLDEALDLSIPKERTKCEQAIATSKRAHYDKMATTNYSEESEEQRIKENININNKECNGSGTKRRFPENSNDHRWSPLSSSDSDPNSSTEQNRFNPENCQNNTPKSYVIQRTLNDVTVYLHDDNLWKSFASRGTEMIINRGGRRMFPHVVLSVEGLDRSVVYTISMEIIPADNRRYKFVNKTWVAMGMSDPCTTNEAIVHPESPNTGAFWLENGISFSKVRLTNNKESSNKKSMDGNILLHSMHKYKVVIKIRKSSLMNAKCMSFIFDETTFIAVTAYQNNQITKLKIQNNPFAKAFRRDDNIEHGQTHNVSQKKGSRTKFTKDINGMPFCPTLPTQSVSGQSLYSWYFPLPSSSSINPYGLGFSNFEYPRHDTKKFCQQYFSQNPLADRAFWFIEEPSMNDIRCPPGNPLLVEGMGTSSRKCWYLNKQKLHSNIPRLPFPQPILDTNYNGLFMPMPPRAFPDVDKSNWMTLNNYNCDFAKKENSRDDRCKSSSSDEATSSSSSRDDSSNSTSDSAFNSGGYDSNDN